MKVYLVQHERESDEGNEVKVIGIYASETDAVEATRRLSSAPGFRDHPKGFSIDAYEVGEDQWATGFTATGSGPAARVQAA